MNNTKYILAGPNSRDYFYHSPGLEQALQAEESSWPVQGNIGVLMVQDPDYSNCINDVLVAPPVGSSPNCTNTFTPDLYTLKDTCGDECLTKYPESYGRKDFGFPEDAKWQDKITNASSIHAYTNRLAVMPGQGPGAVLGPAEYIPRIGINNQDTGFMDPNPAYKQVGNFFELPQFNNISQIRWTKF
jgi:hypothetical protein